MKTSQSFPFYPTDFLMGTMFMTPSQVGGYIRALCYQWESGGFPVLPEEQKRVTGCDENDLKIILGKFSQKRGVLVNRKMEEVRKARAEYAKTQRDNGKKGGRPRKNPPVSIGLSENEPKKSLPSPSPSPSPSPNTPIPPQAPPAFEEFWRAYPNKKAKAHAIKAWNHAIKLATPETIINAVNAAKRGEDWAKDNGRFIPHPASWLNGQRWLDEIKPARPKY